LKKFLSRYSYDFVKMFLDQFATAVFGFSLAVTAVSMKSNVMLLLCSLAAIAFYLVLIYGVAWKIGYGDRAGVRNGEIKASPWRGLFISLAANSVNIILAVAVAIEAFLGKAGATVLRAIAILIQAMYQGLLSYVKIGGEALNNRWWVYFLIIIPALVASTLGYNAGYADFHITSAGIPDLPASDRPTRAELKERKKRDKENKR